MCQYGYYTVMRESKEPAILRLRMIIEARKIGIKPAARKFHTTVKTVRKWFRRYDGTKQSLNAKSRRPLVRANKISQRDEKVIINLKKLLPTFSARRLKAEFELSWAAKTMRRVFRDNNLLRRYRRKKYRTKHCLREIKKHWRLFQQISIDTKDLSDIPEYWPGLRSRRLPRYQHTARDVCTGLLFLGYADRQSLAYSAIFAQRIIQHLISCGCDLSNTCWQSDNGSEFIGSWQSKDDSIFTKVIEFVPGQKHRTIPPGQHRFQADVETVHSLMEDEFYMLERFESRDELIEKANAYQMFFNIARKNSGKEDKTPWQLVVEKNRSANKKMPLLDVADLNKIAQKNLAFKNIWGYDVGALPFFKKFLGIF